MGISLQVYTPKKRKQYWSSAASIAELLTKPIKQSEQAEFGHYYMKLYGNPAVVICIKIQG